MIPMRNTGTDGPSAVASSFSAIRRPIFPLPIRPLLSFSLSAKACTVRNRERRRRGGEESTTTRRMVVVPLGKGHLPVTETNRTGYVLGGVREREAACRATDRSGGEGEKERERSRVPISGTSYANGP